MSLNHDVMTDVYRDDGGKWFVVCQVWDDREWQTANRLTGFTTRKSAIEAARAWRRSATLGAPGVPLPPPPTGLDDEAEVLPRPDEPAAHHAADE